VGKELLAIAPQTTHNAPPQKAEKYTPRDDTRHVDVTNPVTLLPI
jgi:hypothetical protein